MISFRGTLSLERLATHVTLASPDDRGLAPHLAVPVLGDSGPTVPVAKEGCDDVRDAMLHDTERFVRDGGREAQGLVRALHRTAVDVDRERRLGRYREGDVLWNRNGAAVIVGWEDGLRRLKVLDWVQDERERGDLADADWRLIDDNVVVRVRVG